MSASTESAAPAAPPSASGGFNGAENYDDYEPRTPEANEDYNRRASEPGVRICAELPAAAMADDVNGIQNILRSGVPIDCHDQDGGGQTGLIAAAGAASVDATRYLIDHGADVNARDNSGMTALGRATYMRNQMASAGQLPNIVARFDAIIQVLQSHGAS